MSTDSTGTYENVARTLTALEKSLDRLARSNYYNRSQYPEIILAIEEAIGKVRAWLKCYRKYDRLGNFYMLLGPFIGELGAVVGRLWDICRPEAGKRKESEAKKKQRKNRLAEALDAMLARINVFLGNLQNEEGSIATELDKGLAALFNENIVREFRERITSFVSRRGEKTYIFPCADKNHYLILVNDADRFRCEVVDQLRGHRYKTGHRSSCTGSGKYRLCGFRKNPRKTTMVGGKREIFPVRMVECIGCGQKFSLLPSFLPREKNYAMEIVESACRNLFLFQQSLQGTLESLKLAGKDCVKSKQTLYNWIRWLGTHHPASVLTRAGIEGSGYFQEDEGFEKEPDLRTYAVVIVDPRNHLVWHADYVDRVDEQTLHTSFEEFAKRISFQVLGVTKDKWQASTNALKRVCHRLWIGYCHRHCLKRFREALADYRKETECTRAEVARLYNKFKKVLKRSTSKRNLDIKLKFLDDDAFDHPLLKERLDELSRNAAHYTAHKNRKGITETTSIVDNYLKLVKRKLRQVESYRDRYWTTLFFRAQANTRNFIPYNPGAKNAHQSPFMLAGGESYDLPGFQAMNVHNAFLFADRAV